MSFLHPTPTEEAFITAAASGNLTLVERFAYPERSGSNRRPVRTSIADRGTGRNALIAASRNGRLEMVEYLVSVLNCNVCLQEELRREGSERIIVEAVPLKFAIV